jgi:hypothetical protein
MAAYDVDIDNIDLTWNNILKVYPESVIPSKLKKRTGKVQKTLFEEIDNNLYEKEARMITFHTHVNRIYPWIKTLDTFYYIHLGKQSEYRIKWFDDPQEWKDISNANSIVIEVSQASDEVQLYNLTFFITTGTIRVQGTKYIIFVQKHFPVLKMILQKVPDDGMPVPKTEDKSVLPSALTRQESDDPSSHSDTELKVIEGEHKPLKMQTVATMETKDTTRLEKSLTEAMIKLSNN